MNVEVRRVCQSVVDGGIDVRSATVRLKEATRHAKREDVSLALSCTLFALWDFVVDDGSGAQERLVHFARELYQTGTLDEDVWLSTAEWDLLKQTDAVSNVEDDKRREVRFYTRIVYVQTRFNLYSESPAAFARLFSLLQRVGLRQVGDVRREICRLVGELKIEPHRVLDALLEFLPPQMHPSHQLLALFGRDKAGHILGRKLKLCLEGAVVEGDGAEIDRRPDKLPRTTRLGRGEDLRVARESSSSLRSEKRNPRRYYRLCAALEVGGFLDVAPVFLYLSPTLEQTQQKTQEFLKGLREAAKEQRWPNLNRPLPDQRSRMTEKDKDLHSVYRDPKKFSYQPQNVLQVEAAAPTHEDPLLRLAAGFLETSQPGKALRIVHRLDDVFCKEFTDGCLALLDRILEPFFHKIPLGSRTLDRFLDDIRHPVFPCLRVTSPLVFEWIGATGRHLFRSLDLFRKAALVVMHELRFYGSADYASASLLKYPAPKTQSPEITLSTAFLPSLLMMDPKSGLMAAAWVDGLLKMCSYSVRIMVGIHFEEVAAQSAFLDRCVAMAETAAKNLVKILVTAPDSETFEKNVIPIVDALGQIAICAPFHVTRVMVQKVQTDVMAAKDLATAMLFFTPLAFDAFAHHIVMEVVSTGLDRKHVDGRISQWYKNMLTFLGHVAHDFPELLPLHFIIQNTLKEISQTEVIHTHVLRELVHFMTGFQHCSEIGNSQFATLSGGPMLKSIGLLTPWQKDEVGYNAAAVALKRTLALPPRNRRAESGRKLTLGGQMFVLLMKFLDYIPIRGDFADVSSIMEMHSVVHGTFLAFMEFLSVYCTALEYSEMLPSMDYVLNGLKLPMHYVAHLYRPSIGELRVVQGGQPRIPAPPSVASLDHLQKLLRRLQSTDVEMETGEDLQRKELLRAIDRSGLTSIDPSLFHKYGVGSVRSFYDFVEAIRRNEDFLRREVWDVMSPEFYAFFWSFKLNDITVSETLYRKQTAQIQEELEGPDHDAHSETTLHRLQHKLAAITAEREQQSVHVKFCRDFIRSRQDALLADIPTEKLRSFVDAFLQLCLYPRIRLGHEDALFAFEFVLLMTKTGAKNFPTLFILDKVVKELFPCLICMTDNEAEGFANFMYEFLRQMERWRSSKLLFSKEFGTMPGALEKPYTAGATELVTHDNFLKVMAKWSNVIARLLKECLQPPETAEGVDPVKHRKIMRRPALLVLDRLIPIFPTLSGLAMHLHTALVYVTEHDKDEGMKTSAQAALARLNKEMESRRPGRWLLLDDYNISTKDPESAGHQESAQMEIDPPVKEEEEGEGSPVEMEEQEEGMISVKEEGEIDKAAAKRVKGRKVTEDATQRSAPRKRSGGKSDSTPSAEATPKAHGRDDAKRKRGETPVKVERLKGPKREEPRRKS